MNTPEQLKALIQLVETGVLKLGESRGLSCKGVFSLEEWEAGFDLAAKEAKAGNFVLLQPSQE